MIDKINGANPARRIDQANTQASSSGQAEAKKTEAPSTARDSSSLTAAKAQAELQNVSDVNMDKVEQIKTAIAEGNYHIDADKVAKAFSNLEELLQGA